MNFAYRKTISSTYQSLNEVDQLGSLGLEGDCCVFVNLAAVAGYSVFFA